MVDRPNRSSRLSESRERTGVRYPRPRMIDVDRLPRRQRTERAVRARHLGLAGRLVGHGRRRSPPPTASSSRASARPGPPSTRWSSQELVEPLQRRVRGDGVPFLGICIGLQVLFDHSEEGDTTCLGWVPGTVRRFPDTGRVPQIGWNAVRFARDAPASPRTLPDARPLLLRELVLLRARPIPPTCSASPTTASSSARSSRATTSSPPSSTPRRAARSGCALLRGFADVGRHRC